MAATAPTLRKALQGRSPSLAPRAGAVGRRARDRRRHGRGRPGRLGGSAHARRRRAAPRSAGLQGPRLQAAHRGASARPCSTASRVVHGVGGRPRHRRGVRRARHERGAAAGRPPGARGARAAARPGAARRQVGLRRRRHHPSGSSGATPAACRSRRRRSWPRSPATASCGPRPSTTPGGGSTPTRATPARATRPSLRGVGPVGDPPPQLGVHGVLPWGGVQRVVRPDPQGVLFDLTPGRWRGTD